MWNRDDGQLWADFAHALINTKEFIFCDERITTTIPVKRYPPQPTVATRTCLLAARAASLSVSRCRLPVIARDAKRCAAVSEAALAGLLNELLAIAQQVTRVRLATARTIRCDAKNVIFLYMDGGPSQVDTFDPKPMLDKYNGQDPGQIV